MKKQDLIAAIIAFALIFAFIGAIVMLSWRSFPSSNEQLLTYMIGQLSGFVAMALGVYFSRRAESPPSGTPQDPLHTQVGNTSSDPVPTTEEETKK